MKTTLIFLGVLAVVLAIFAYFAVFGAPTGSYSVSALDGASGATSSLTDEASSSLSLASSTDINSSSTTGGLDANGASSTIAVANYGSSFATPALSWPESQAKISITALSIEGSEMTFTLMVQTGGAPECVPLNLRLVSDEEGDLSPPNPAAFSFPDSGNCNGAPNQTYMNQTTTFVIDPTALPLLFTTGGASNIFFEVTTSTGNGLQVDFPGTSG